MSRPPSPIESTHEQGLSVSRRDIAKLALGIGGAAATAALLLPSTAGATKVTVNPSGSPVFQVFDVTDYGAFNDGTNATATTAAIASAISAAAATNGVVFFPRGTFAINQTLTVGSTVVLQGSGGRSGTTVITGTQSGTLLSIQASSVQVRDIYFNNQGSGSAITTLGNVSGIAIQECTIQNASGNSSDLVYLTTSYSSVDRCEFKNGVSTAYSLHCARVSGTLQLDSRFTNNIFGGTGKGILISTSVGGARPEGIKVQSNFFDQGSEQLTVKSVYGLDVAGNTFGNTNQYAIYIVPTTVAVENVHVRGNLLDTDQNQSSGICLYAPQTSIGLKSIAVVENSFAFAGTGISLVGYSSTTSTAGGISGVQIIGNSFRAISGAGVVLNLVQRAIIQGNFFEAFGSAFWFAVWGGYLGSGSTYADFMIVRDNLVSGNLAKSPSNMDSSASNMVLTGNMSS